MKNEPNLGQLADANAGRDAVHIAVIPIEAGTMLVPGQHVGLVGGKAVPLGQPIGIVDPFFRAAIAAGQTFWLFLYPKTITSLRHEWTHPAFPAAENKPDLNADSMAFLKAIADEGKVSVEHLIESAVNGDGITVHDYDWHPDIGDEFWEHIEAVTGKKFVKAHRDGTWFTCSC